MTRKLDEFFNNLNHDEQLLMLYKGQLAEVDQALNDATREALNAVIKHAQQIREELNEDRLTNISGEHIPSHQGVCHAIVNASTQFISSTLG